MLAEFTGNMNTKAITHNHSVEKEFLWSVYVIGARFGLTVNKIVQSLKFLNVPRFKTIAE